MENDTRRDGFETFKIADFLTEEVAVKKTL